MENTPDGLKNMLRSKSNYVYKRKIALKPTQSMIKSFKKNKDVFIDKLYKEQGHLSIEEFNHLVDQLNHLLV